MKVYCNTTPVIALCAIGQLELLPQLFGQVHFVDEVIAECSIGGPVLVPDLLALPWVRPVSVARALPLHVLLELDQGEKATLQGALADKADLVLIDEKIGRNMAEYLGLRVSGTLGVLLKARANGLIPSFVDAANAMRQQGIFYNVHLIEQLARRVGEAA